MQSTEPAFIVMTTWVWSVDTMHRDMTSAQCSEVWCVGLFHCSHMLFQVFMLCLCVSASVSSQQTQKTYRTLPFRTVEITSTDGSSCDGETNLVIQMIFITCIGYWALKVWHWPTEIKVISHFQCSKREPGSSHAACKRLKDQREEISSAGIKNRVLSDSFMFHECSH